MNAVRWRRAAIGFLPRRAVTWLKKMYYPGLVRNFPEQRWPGAEFVRKLVRPGDCVVDAGANIGYVSALLSRWVGPAGVVHSFEPVPETFELLRHNMASAGFRNVVPHACALSSGSGEARMMVPDYPGGGRNLYESRLARAGETSFPDAVRVETASLDDLATGWTSPITFIKIDVEGHELEAVRGSRSLLGRDHPALYIEVSGDPDETSSPAAELVLLLSELGYTAYSADNGRLRARRHSDRAVDYFFLTSRHIGAILPTGK